MTFEWAALLCCVFTNFRFAVSNSGTLKAHKAKNLEIRMGHAARLAADQISTSYYFPS